MASASLPARSNRDDSIKRTKRQTALDTLVSMGFPRNRAEKAIAATGDRGIQLASDWLLSHVDDPTLDDGTPREYVLYLCPNGKMQDELNKFWEKSLTHCGWNGAHSYFPHITMCPFFTVDDKDVGFLSESFVKLENKLRRAPDTLKLDFFSQMNFIGLFVKDTMYEFLQECVSMFSKELAKGGVKVEPHKKQLHLTLAYQYPPEQHDKLLKYAKEIDLGVDVRWDLRLYSRDPRAGRSEIRRVVKAYTPQVGDELELIDGDFIFLDPKELTKTKDGWYPGISWLTGILGMFPGVYTQKTAETWTWMLHRSLPLHVRPKSVAVTNGIIVEEDYDAIWHDDKDYAKVNKNFVKEKKQSLPSVEKREQRRLIICRHGERTDFAMGKGWYDMCFDDDGRYSRINLNLPKKMLTRSNNLEYINDPPLTEVGKLQAQLTADTLTENRITIAAVYSSPSLRCVQTATEIYQVLKIQNKIKIEPGLFEWTGHTNVVPRWISPEDLSKQGYPVDTSYLPQVPRDKLEDGESISNLYARSTETSRQILKLYESKGGSILFIGHSGTLDLCTRVITGQTPRTTMSYREFLPKVPYVAMCAIEEDVITRKWKFIDPPTLPLSHGRNIVQNVRDILNG
ncbi:ecdysteroid-phosphate phosphatase-like [Saccostrea cucullata]|uniref:ecdysteroid-phosphate phosphatase-like n=1 Tax=Saccostrea cuccullata TaxID=36930 RepID=UPI002ED11BB0